MLTPGLFPRAAATLLVALLTTGAGAQQLDVRSPQRQATLVELFTSEGCSSCPPADAWMSRLKDDPRLWRELIPVAFHVDYWDYIGWPDRFAVPANARRQRDYARAGTIGSVYTPGLVANGQEWRGWFRSPVLDTDSTPDVGSLGIQVRDGQLSARFEPTRPAQKLFLNVALLGFDLSSDVKAGENHGRTLRHDFVVLGFERLPLKDDGAARVARSTLPEPRLKSPRYGVAAWVSAEGSQVPLQATGGMLTP